MQATLALVGPILGAIAWWQTGTLAFLAGGLVILAAWPWTLVAIAPTNKALMATVIAKAGPETRARIVKWDALHRVRTLLGALAVICFLFALSGV